MIKRLIIVISLIAILTPSFSYASITFNGSSQYVTIKDSANLRVESGPFTLAVWVKLAVQPTTSGSTAFFALMAKTNSLGGWSWVYSDDSGACAGGTFFSLAKIGVVDQCVFVNLPIKQWIHLAAVQQSGQVTYYVNGVSVGSFVDASAYNASTNMAVGLAAEDWTGSINSPANTAEYDARIYNRALLPSEVRALAIGTYAPTYGLVGWWPLWGVGTTEGDASGKRNVGRPVGFTLDRRSHTGPPQGMLW